MEAPMKLFYCVLAILFLGGCANSGLSVIPLDAYNEAGEVIGQTTATVADASIAKELAYVDMRKARDRAVAKVPTKMDISFSVEQVAGVVYVLPNIQSQEAPVFEPMPSGPSEHPVWGTFNTAIRTITPYGFGYLAVDSITGAFKSFADNAGDTYQGPVVMSQSHNTAGTHQEFIGNGGQSIGDEPCIDCDVVEPVEPVESEYPNDEWYSPGCSMDSHNNGDC